MRQHRGMSLIDAIVTLVVLGAVTTPIATGIVSISQGALQNYRAAAVRCELVYESERLLALPFSDLSVGSTDTTIELPGGSSTRTVTISQADYDGDAVVDAALLKIVVSIDGQEITFFQSDWKE